MLLAAVGSASVKTALADPTVTEKRAQAEDVLSQIREIDSQLSHAIEAYNLANVQLDQIDADLIANARHLRIAKRSLKGAQGTLSRRLVALYVNGGRSTGLDVLLGAESLDQLLNRLDAVDRVTKQDADVLRDLKVFRADVQSRKLKLRRARTAQARVVGERAAQKSTIEAQLRAREQMLASVREEIAQLEAAEAARQARLQAAARARVAAIALEPEDAATVAPAIEQAVSSEAAAVPDARYGGVVGIAMQYLGIPTCTAGRAHPASTAPA